MAPRHQSPMLPERSVAILVADGIRAESTAMLQSQLAAAGAAARLVAVKEGAVRSADGQEFYAAVRLEDGVAPTFDGLALPDADQAVHTLAANSKALRFISDQYRFGQAVLVPGAALALIAKARLSTTVYESPGARPFLTGETFNEADVMRFIKAIGSPQN